MRIALLALALVLLVGRPAAADDPQMEQKQRHVGATGGWTGERADPLPKVEGGVIIEDATWQRFWKYANLPGACSKVNFTTHVVVVTTHSGWSRVVTGWLHVDEHGAAKAKWFSQPDRIAGSYGIMVFPRSGIKSINGHTISGDL